MKKKINKYKSLFTLPINTNDTICAVENTRRCHGM